MNNDQISKSVYYVKLLYFIHTKDYVRYTDCTFVSLSVFHFALIVIIILNNNESIPIMYLYTPIYYIYKQ